MRIAEKDVFGNERYEMKIGVPREIHPGECRVAASPKNVERLKKMGFEVAIETGAGSSASFPDSAYEAVGAEIVADAASLWANADIVIKVRPPAPHPVTGTHEASMLNEGGTLISFIWPGENKEVVEALQARKATVLAIDDGCFKVLATAGEPWLGGDDFDVAISRWLASRGGLQCARRQASSGRLARDGLQCSGCSKQAAKNRALAHGSDLWPICSVRSDAIRRQRWRAAWPGAAFSGDHHLLARVIFSS